MPYFYCRHSVLVWRLLSSDPSLADGQYKPYNFIRMVREIGGDLRFGDVKNKKLLIPTFELSRCGRRTPPSPLSLSSLLSSFSLSLSLSLSSFLVFPWVS